MATEQPFDLKQLPKPDSQGLLDFERVEIVTLESFPPQFILAVSGTKPIFNIDVRLVPLMYIRRPEYWGIEVVFSFHGEIQLPATAPYTATLHLNPGAGTGFIGTRGIEVIGASRSERVDLSTDGAPTGELPPEIFKHWVHSFEEDTDAYEVYRPVGFDFPPARGRRGLQISPNGEFILHAIGPADGTVLIPGHWTTTAEDELSVSLPGCAPFTLTIVSVDDDVLQLRGNPPGGL